MQTVRRCVPGVALLLLQGSYWGWHCAPAELILGWGCRCLFAAGLGVPGLTAGHVMPEYGVEKGKKGPSVSGLWIDGKARYAGLRVGSDEAQQ